jgi:hypothetical protein
VDSESIFYDEDELKEKDGKDRRVSFEIISKNAGGAAYATGEAGAALDANGMPIKKKTAGELIKLAIDKIINFIVCAILGGVGMFLFLRGFSSFMGSFAEVSFPEYWIFGVCIAMGLGLGVISILGDSVRERRGNDYLVNASDIKKREESSDKGIWKVMSEEEKQRNARMEQRRLEAEAEAEELRAMSEGGDKEE